MAFHSLEDRIVKRFMTRRLGRGAGTVAPRPARAAARVSAGFPAADRRGRCAPARGNAAKPALPQRPAARAASASRARPGKAAIMIRPLTIVTFLMACGSGLYLYQIEARGAGARPDNREDRARYRDLREQSRLLAAEWTMLNDPERLRQFSDTYLALKTITPTQFTSLADLDARLPPVPPPPTRATAMRRPVNRLPAVPEPAPVTRRDRKLRPLSSPTIRFRLRPRPAAASPVAAIASARPPEPEASAASRLPADGCGARNHAATEPGAAGRARQRSRGHLRQHPTRLARRPSGAVRKPPRRARLRPTVAESPRCDAAAAGPADNRCGAPSHPSVSSAAIDEPPLPPR